MQRMSSSSGWSTSIRSTGPRFARKFWQHWHGCTSRNTPGQSAWCADRQDQRPVRTVVELDSRLGSSRNTQSAHLPFGSGRSSRLPRLHRRRFGFVHSAMAGPFMHRRQFKVSHFDAAWRLSRASTLGRCCTFRTKKTPLSEPPPS